jgi:Mce-associated membrane protein
MAVVRFVNAVGDMSRLRRRKLLRRPGANSERDVDPVRSPVLVAAGVPTEDASVSPAPGAPCGHGPPAQRPADADPEPSGGPGDTARAGDDPVDWPDDAQDHASDEADDARVDDSESAHDDLGEAAVAPTANPAKARRASRWRRQMPIAAMISLLTMVVLGGLTVWYTMGAQRSERLEHQRDVLLQAGRQAALNLTTIGYTDVDAGMQRILESSTGAFHDDFQQRSKPLADVIRQTQSRTEGTVAAAGLESVTGDSAQVLVAVSVKTSDQSAADQPPRTWRMRIDIQQVDGQAKVSNVAFVP